MLIVDAAGRRDFASVTVPFVAVPLTIWSMAPMWRLALSAAACAWLASLAPSAVAWRMGAPFLTARALDLIFSARVGSSVYCAMIACRFVLPSLTS